jgi:hypothetical protein
VVPSRRSVVIDDIQPKPLLEFLGSLSFGGMLGGGIAALIYTLLIFPSVSSAPFVPFLIGGAFIGAALHRPLDILWNMLIGPVFRSATTEIQVRKPYRYRRRGLITQKRFNELAEAIITDDILGRPISHQSSHPNLQNTTARSPKRFLSS